MANRPTPALPALTLACGCCLDMGSLEAGLSHSLLAPLAAASASDLAASTSGALRGQVK